MSTLYVLSGLPASGKSTVARELQMLLLQKGRPVLVAQSDAVRRAMFPERTYSSDESVAVFSRIYAGSGESLERGVDVIVDATNLTEESRRPYFDMWDDVLLIVVTADEEDVKKRMANRAGPGRHPLDLSEADMSVYEMMRAISEWPRDQFFHVNTSRKYDLRHIVKVK